MQKIQVKGIYKPVELTKILYVPDLAKNLFSISAVVKMGLSFVFKEDNCFILNSDGEIIGSGRKDRKLFILDCLPFKIDAWSQRCDSWTTLAIIASEIRPLRSEEFKTFA